MFFEFYVTFRIPLVIDVFRTDYLNVNAETTPFPERSIMPPVIIRSFILLPEMKNTAGHGKLMRAEGKRLTMP